MPKPTSPCKDCAEREVGCHGRCERYKTWRAEMDERREQRRTIKAAYYDAQLAKWRTINKLRKRYNLK